MINNIVWFIHTIEQNFAFNIGIIVGVFILLITTLIFLNKKLR